MKALILALATAGLMTACASSPTLKKETTMTQAERPVLTPPEVLMKALDFIRAAESPEDFKIAKAEEVMKIKFLEHADKTGGGSDFYTSNNFGDSGWSWSFNFINENGGTMLLSLSRGGRDIPATPICQLDLDQFHPMLEQAGFTYNGRGNWGRPFSGYVKDYPNGYHADVRVTYVGESAEKVTHDCIDGITFRVYKIGVWK